MNFIPLKADKVITSDLNRAGYSHYVVQCELNRIKEELRFWNKLDDEKKFNLLNRYYLVKCSINDIFELINDINDTNYSQLVDLSTKMGWEKEKSTEPGEDFKWWTTNNKVHYICAIENRFNIDDIDYSKAELEDLAKSKIVLPITTYLEEIKNPNQHFDEFDYVRLLNTYGIDIGELKLDYDENGNFVKNNGCLVPAKVFYDIKVSPERIKNYMKIANRDISTQEIIENTYYYIDSLIKMLQREESENYQEELNTLYKLGYKKTSSKILKRA